MSKKQCYIEGFWDRINSVCEDSGLTKGVIARRTGLDRKTLYPQHPNQMMSSAYLAKFCAATGADANWILVISGTDHRSRRRT